MRTSVRGGIPLSKISRAIISVSDKTGIVDFAKELAAMGVEIISTGGTYKLLKENGIAVTEVAEVTGFPEMLDGRVKTLHPMIHAGILARRDVKEHMDAIAAKGIKPVDMVVVNLYPSSTSTPSNRPSSRRASRSTRSSRTSTSADPA